MNPLARSASAGIAGEFTIGAADIDARAQGAATVGRGNVIRAFRVTSGSGAFVYEDERGPGVPVTLNLQTDDEISPEDGITVRKIYGTGNSAPSAALSLRCEW